MAIRQSRGRWTVEFQQGGSRVFKRLPPGITKAQAQEYEVRLRRGIFDSERLGKKPDITLTDAIGRWLLENHRKDQRKARSEAKQWEPWVKGKMLRQAPEVAQAAIGLWMDGSSARNVILGRGESPPIRRANAPATINRRLAMLKAVCKHAYKTGLIADNLSGRITMLPERNKREVYLTRAQVMRLSSQASEPCVSHAIMLAAYTGLRASELLAMRREDITPSGSLRVLVSKTGKPRVVPVPTPVRPLLSALPLPLSYWQLHKQFLAACKKAKMKGLRFHDLRHTCASWLINEGVDLYVVGQILGHTTTQTTARYAHLAKDTLERAMSRLK